jgi:Ca2+-transporting ATPase
MALEPRDPDLMQQPPRDPTEPIVPGRMLRRILAESAAIALGALAVYGLGIARHGLGPVAQTMAFASLLGSQLLHVGWARAGDRPALTGNRGRRNTYLVGAMALSAGLQAAALFIPPLRAVLGGAPLGLADLGIAVAGAVLPSAAIETSRILAGEASAPRSGIDSADQDRAGRPRPASTTGTAGPGGVGRRVRALSGGVA